MNSWFDRVCSRILYDIPEVQFIDYSQVSWVARSDHKWGRAPYHFTSSCEESALNSLKNYCFAIGH
jgi:hypothetical protein